MAANSSSAPDLTNEGQLILNLRETVTVGGIDRPKTGKLSQIEA